MIVTNLTANGIVNINVANGLQLTTGQFVLVDYEGSIGGAADSMLSSSPTCRPASRPSWSITRPTARLI